MELIGDLIKKQFANINYKDSKSEYNLLNPYMTPAEYELIKDELKDLIQFRYNLPASEINDSVIQIKKEAFLSQFVKRYITSTSLKELNDWADENKNVKINYSVDKSKFMNLYEIRKRYQSQDNKIQKIGELEIIVYQIDKTDDSYIDKSTQIYNPKKNYILNGKMLKNNSYEPEPETKYKNYSNYQDK
jgi:hypothetical protein